MKKENFVSLVLGVSGALVLGIGMCMTTLTEWNAFKPGIIVGAVGLVLLLIMVLVRRKMKGLPPIKLSGKAIGTAALGIVGALALGVGMCMTMVWENLLLWGIVVGCVGIMILLSLIPLCRGLK